MLHKILRNLPLIWILFAVAKGSAPSAPVEYKPSLNENVCYIVAVVLVDDRGAVLMMQEAKRYF